MRKRKPPEELLNGGAAEGRFVAFDVETPNDQNNRMSSIGIAVIENGAVVDTFSSLVNPQTWFDSFNIRLTGISPGMVQDAPTFRELWGTIAPLLQSGILLAHNAPFDMRVLSHCLRAYQVSAPRYAEYACTVRMGQACYPDLPDHKLDTLCRYRSIPLDHHQADSDSRACAELYLDYLNHGLDLGGFLRTYDLFSRRTLPR